MVRFGIVWMLAAAAFGAQPRYRIEGRFTPAAPARIFLHSATTPLTLETQTRVAGQFAFKKVPPGSYTIAVFYAASHGMGQRTIDVGPKAADKRRRVQVVLRFEDGDLAQSDAQHSGLAVSVLELAVPRSARREYEQAQKDLAKPDAASAVKHLERAVDLAPQFAAVWNNLGVIAYHERKFERAEECFRNALVGNPEAYDPMVNLGGVLLVEHKLDDAIDLNVHAVATRPGDALAQAQLGMCYFQIGNFDLAVKHLELARRIDPGHFSQPQLTLAEIHLRLHEPRLAAEDMEDFLKYHPDYPSADKMRATISSLKK